MKSPISRVHEAAQKLKIDLEFNVISETGKSHKKNFVTECKLGEFRTEGEGKSKKESKRAAAEKMVENLHLLPEIIDGKAILNSSGKKKKKKINKNNVIKNNFDVIAGVDNILDSLWSSEKVNNC